MEWDLLRTFESVARLGSLTAAARALGVSQSTVSRQINKLEEVAGSPLLLRETPVQPTEKGAALLEAVRPMVDAALTVQSTLEEAPQLHGEVTLTTVGELLRWVLAPALELRLGTRWRGRTLRRRGFGRDELDYDGLVAAREPVTVGGRVFLAFRLDIRIAQRGQPVGKLTRWVDPAFGLALQELSETERSDGYGTRNERRFAQATAVRRAG